MTPVISKLFYVLVAPDGTPQTMTLAQETVMCISIVNMMSSVGLCDKLSVLLDKGYVVQQVQLTII